MLIVFVHLLIALAYAEIQMSQLTMAFKVNPPEIPEEEQTMFSSRMFGVIIGTSLTWEIQLLCWLYGVLKKGAKDE